MIRTYLLFFLFFSLLQYYCKLVNAVLVVNSGAFGTYIGYKGTPGLLRYASCYHPITGFLFIVNLKQHDRLCHEAIPAQLLRLGELLIESSYD